MRIPVKSHLPPYMAQRGRDYDDDDEDSEATLTLLWAQLLIPGRGDPINNGGVAIKNGKIDWVGHFQSRPSKYRDIRPTYVHVLMPGMWDCHVHFMGVEVATSVNSLNGYQPSIHAQVGAVSVDDFRATLMAGYTSVRELNGYGADLWPLVESGAIVGPNVYASVSALSITGGHADDHNLPITTVMEAMNHGANPIGICDGVEECVKAVRLMVRRGARVIKVCSSGGVLSLNDDPEDRQFSDEELKAIVDEAARSRRAVAAHAIGKAGIMAGIRAGVKSIEHGMYIDDEVADLMVEKDVYFVPTQHIQRTLRRDYMDILPEPVKRKLLKVSKAADSSYKTALRKGVKFALGTDMASSNRNSALSHGNNAWELKWAVEMGMTPIQAIEAATANAPATLGGMAPLSGQIKEGYDADIIAVKSSPLDNIEVLTDPDNITHVWKGGKVFKAPKYPSWTDAEGYVNVA